MRPCKPFISLDYQKRVQIAAGSTITLTATSQEGLQVKNIDPKGQPIVITGLPPAPDPFDGQWIQIDVVDIALAP